MKIKRFNESLKGKYYKPTDKVLKVSVEDFEVLIDEIRDTTKFQEYGKSTGINNWKKEELFYGLEEWIYTAGNPVFNYQLYDGLGNPIEDEEEFDKQIKDIKKYNI